MSRAVERLTDCIPSNTYVTTNGSIYYTHTRLVNPKYYKNLEQS